MLEISKEIWKESIYPQYLVSNLGRVKNKNGKILSKRVCTSNGYNYASLWINGVNKCQKVSRLVAFSFLEKDEGKEFVDHINTIRTDDRACNLRWCTRSENMNNEITKNRMQNKPFRRNFKRMKPIVQLSENGEFIKEWESATLFGESINKDVCGNINACINGKQKTAYGFKWKYKDEN